jgi:hypothetical protein
MCSIMGCVIFLMKPFPGALHLTVNIPSLVMDISWSALNGCDNPSLSLIYPQEILDFIGNVCTIQYQVHAYSFIQSRNIITCLSSIQALSQDHVIKLFSRRIHVFNVQPLSQSVQEELFHDDLC